MGTIPGFFFPDIDECQVNNARCAQNCSDIDGSYLCSCNEGYDLYVENGTNYLYIPEGETGLYWEDKYYINHTCVRK